MTNGGFPHIPVHPADLILSGMHQGNLGPQHGLLGFDIRSGSVFQG